MTNNRINKTITQIICTVCVIVLTACSTFNISKESLVTQLEKNQKVGNRYNVLTFPIIITEYPSNNLKKIKCVNEDGKLVWLYPDKNTQFMITRKSDSSSVVKAYFDTLILQSDTLYGLRSRILGGIRKIPVEDIYKVEIYAEFANTENISK